VYYGAPRGFQESFLRGFFCGHSSDEPFYASRTLAEEKRLLKLCFTEKKMSLEKEAAHDGSLAAPILNVIAL
jgi:hypothetical protein